MSDEELQERIADLLEATEGFDIDDQAKAIIDDLGLSVVNIPGGISDYSPFTGKPVVQPDKWHVIGEKVFWEGVES